MVFVERDGAIYAAAILFNLMDRDVTMWERLRRTTLREKILMIVAFCYCGLLLKELVLWLGD